MKKRLLFFTLVGAWHCFGMHQSADTIIQFEAADGSIVSASAADLASSHFLASPATQTLTAPIKVPEAACADDIRAALVVRRLDEAALPNHLQQLPHETCASLIETYATLFRPSARELSLDDAAAQIIDQKHATIIQYYLDRATQELGTSAWDVGVLKRLEQKKSLNRILAHYAKRYIHLPVLAKDTACVVGINPRPFWLTSGLLVACVPPKSNTNPELAIFRELGGLPEKTQFSHQEILNAIMLDSVIVTSSRDTSPSLSHFGLHLHDDAGKVFREAVLRSQPTCLSSTVSGGQLAVGFRDGHVEIWDAQTFKEPTTTFTPHSKPVLFICWGPGEKSIITGSDDCTAASWNLANQRLVIMRHTAPVCASVMDFDGNIITITTDGTAAIWRPNGTAITTLTNKDGTQEKCNCMRLFYYDDGHSLLATGSRDHSVKIWRFDGSLAYTLGGRNGHADAITALAWNSDGSMLASGSYDGVIKFWDVCSQTCLATDHTHNSAIYFLSWPPGHIVNRPNESYITSLDTAGNIRFDCTRIADETILRTKEHFATVTPAENLLLIKLFQNAQQQKKLSQEEYEKIIKLYPHMSAQTRSIAAQIAPEFDWPSTETGTSPAQWLAQKVAYLFGSRKEKSE